MLRLGRVSGQPVFLSYQEHFPCNQYFVDMASAKPYFYFLFLTVATWLSSPFYYFVVTLTCSPWRISGLRSSNISLTSSSIVLQHWFTCAMRSASVLKLAFVAATLSQLFFFSICTCVSNTALRH